VDRSLAQAFPTVWQSSLAVGACFLVRPRTRELDALRIEAKSIHSSTHIDCKIPVLENIELVLVEEEAVVDVEGNVPFHSM